MKDKFSNPQTDFTDDLPFYRHLSKAQKNAFDEAAQLREISAGTLVKSASDDCAGILLLQSGVLRIYLLSEDGKEVTLYRLFPGETCVLSASCLLGQINFDVEIVAQADAVIYQIPMETIAPLMEANIHVENFIHKSAMHRFSKVIRSIESMVFLQLDQRLASFLLEEMDRTGSATLYLTQEEIAKSIASAREVVSRTLAHFQKEEILQLSRGKIVIANRQWLEDYL